MRVDDRTLEQLKALRAVRDRDAGRIGAAYLDLEKVTALCRNSIATSLHTETRIATDALGALGLDPDTETYRITDDGTVQHLNGGAWETVK